MKKDLTPEQANKIFNRWLRLMNQEKLCVAYLKMTERYKQKNGMTFQRPETVRGSLKLKAERYLDSFCSPAPFLPC